MYFCQFFVNYQRDVVFKQSSIEHYRTYAIVIGIAKAETRSYVVVVYEQGICNQRQHGGGASLSFALNVNDLLCFSPVFMQVCLFPSTIYTMCLIMSA